MTLRQDIAHDVAIQLTELEKCLDQAAFLTAGFAGRLVTARSEANLGLNVGAEALTKVAASLGAIAKAREDLAEAHHDLAVVGRAIGARTVMAIGGDKLLTTAEGGTLREVA